MKSKGQIIKFLRWTEKYTKTDMVYVAKGGFWLIFGRISTMLLSLATMFAFARWVSKETFGKYQYIIATINIVAIFLLPAMGAALIRAVAKGKDGMLALCAKAKIKWGLISVIITLFVSLWYFSHGNTSLGISFLIASIMFPLPRVFNLYAPFWKGKKKFDTQAKYQVSINILEALVFIPVLFLTNNLIIILIAYFLSRAIFRGIFFVISLRRRENKETDKETIPFGKHLTLMSAFATFADKIDKIIIWQFLGPMSVAIYSFAQIPVQRSQGLAPFSALALPKLSQKGFAETKKGLFKKFLKFFLFSIPLFLAFIALAPIGYKLLFPNYMEAVPYARVLAISIMFIPFSLLSTALTAGMKTRELYKIKFIAPAIKVLLFLILIPLYGIWGIIFSILLTQIFGNLLTLYLFKKA